MLWRGGVYAERINCDVLVLHDRQLPERPPDGPPTAIVEFAPMRDKILMYNAYIRDLRGFGTFYGMTI